VLTSGIALAIRLAFDAFAVYTLNKASLFDSA
jgi:hypothetical protein